jgi:hypothetical protein
LVFSVNEQLQHIRILGDQFQLVGLHVVHHLGAKVLDLPLVGQLFAAGAESQQKVAFIFRRIHHPHCVAE